jgi:hypothetical protein
MDKTHRKGQQGRTKTKYAYKKLPTYKTLYRIICNTPSAEIPKRRLYAKSLEGSLYSLEGE